MHRSRDMKTATLPSLRVEPALRDDAESVLHEGETLSSFVETAVREQVALRRQREAFIARGIMSREDARRTGRYHDAVEVVGELRQMLGEAKAKAKSGRRRTA
jgi:hypothetical protein